MSVKTRILFLHENNSQGQNYSYLATKYHKTLELSYTVKFPKLKKYQFRNSLQVFQGS